MKNNVAEFITLQKAAELSGKAEQTIRRSIKAGKIVVRKNKTAQGFNYLVDKASLIELYKSETAQIEAKKLDSTSQTPSQPTSPKKILKKVPIESTSQEKSTAIENPKTENYDTIMEFQKLLRNVVEQHQREREHSARFFRELQDKVMFLEHQMIMLQAPKNKWWRFWG